MGVGIGVGVEVGVGVGGGRVGVSVGSGVGVGPRGKAPVREQARLSNTSRLAAREITAGLDLRNVWFRGQKYSAVVIGRKEINLKVKKTANH